jgi:hypothetical protein
MSKATRIKIKIIVKDNKTVLTLLFTWFSVGFLVFRFSYGFSICDALRASLFFKEVDGDFSSAYNTWTQGVIFGVTFSLLFQNILEKYNPERSCRMLAKEMRDHIIIIGHSHLGRRLALSFKEHSIPFCVIEKDADQVDELLRAGDAVIVDDAREEDALEDANADKAKAVLIASNNLETALLVTKRVRDRNKSCLIIARCYQDDFVEILETLGANLVISSSKNAFEDIAAKMNL